MLRAEGGLGGAWEVQAFNMGRRGLVAQALGSQLRLQPLHYLHFADQGCGRGAGTWHPGGHMEGKAALRNQQHTRQGWWVIASTCTCAGFLCAFLHKFLSAELTSYLILLQAWLK